LKSKVRPPMPLDCCARYHKRIFYRHLSFAPRLAALLVVSC
jgi:hypothetical protein